MGRGEIEAMVSIPQARMELASGQRMERAKFLRLWEQLPDLKCAELIDGVVYVASPVSITHATWDGLAILWLGLYSGETPDTLAGGNATWLMLDSAPQPDAHLCILPEAGGQAQMTGTYFAGAPELAVEVSLTSTEIDFGPKMALYARAGVREYITIEPNKESFTWRRLVAGSYRPIKPDAAGVLHSQVFPGLCIDPAVFWARDSRGIRLALERGCATPAHAAFVKRLARRRTQK